MDMRFIYATDLHGNINKYEKLYYWARDHKIKLIHIGADILPKGSNILKKQKKFIRGFLRDWYNRCKDDGIQVIGFFGNDDIYTRKKYIKEYMTLLDEDNHRYKGYILDKAYPYVKDYPFGLKTACKKDSNQSEYVEYISSPVEFDTNGMHEIDNVDEYFKNKGTIKEDLDNKKINKPDEIIASFHMPPNKCGLDACYGYNCVGSKSVYDWILKEQPLLFLCGHIHESPSVTGVWKTKLNNTLVVQPGDRTFVYFILDKNKINSYLISY